LAQVWLKTIATKIASRVFSGAMAKTLILSLFLWAAAAAVDLNAGVPKPHPSIDTDKYETVADKREVALYQRHMKQTCSYPNSTFGCADLHEDIKATVSTLRCLVCDNIAGWKTNSRATFCAKDGSSHVEVHYLDVACQDYNGAQPLPVFQNTTASAANRSCYTGLPALAAAGYPPYDWSQGCTADLDILWSERSDQPYLLCTPGKCSASHPLPMCTGNGYCDDNECGDEGQPAPCEDAECCKTEGGETESIAAYQWWYEFRSSRYVCDEKHGQCVAASEGGQPQEVCQGSCKKSQYECKNNQCVVATSGGGNHDECLKFCGSIAV